ncbi:MAG: hypothetical protein E6R08_00805 [Nevskiaceae bacterium]|nr:MAG: hypothetical protein E6R08_00805 [Nevskiaceae bacterium]
MPNPAGDDSVSTVDFLRRSLAQLPSCSLLAFDSFQALATRSEQRPSRFCEPGDLAMVARVRAALFGEHDSFSVPLGTALDQCAGIAAIRYRFAHRPARSDFLVQLALGLLSAARSGAIDRSVIAASLSPVFPEGVNVGDVVLVLDVFVSSLAAMPHFSNPILGQALCESYSLIFKTVLPLSDSLLGEVFQPALLPLASVAAAAAFSPGTSVIAKREAGAAMPDSLVTERTRPFVRIESKYLPALTTTIEVRDPHALRIRCDRDTFNTLAALLLLPSAANDPALGQFSWRMADGGQDRILSVGVGEKRIKLATFQALQKTAEAHLSDPAHVFWSNRRAVMMGDF